MSSIAIRQSDGTYIMSSDNGTYKRKNKKRKKKGASMKLLVVECDECLEVFNVVNDIKCPRCGCREHSEVSNNDIETSGNNIKRMKEIIPNYN